MKEECWLTTTPGLLPALLEEARALGEAEEGDGGVTLRGPPGLHRRANLWLRCASWVLLRMGRSLSPYWDGKRPVRFEGPRRLVAAARAEWKVPEGDGDDALVIVLRDDGAYVGTSGELLSRRGYRQEVGRAPLRESLAAAMLIYAGYRGEEPLWDPMCGSGTIAIEGALIARRRAPGLARSFAFEAFPSFDSAAWKREVAQARAGERAAPAPIIAGDINAGALGTARRNARRAGVELTLERAELKPRPGPGLLVANLPYGKRVGERSELGELYRKVGAALNGWRYALLVGEERAVELMGIQPTEVREIDNGGLQTWLII